jgi:hypothetical protein
LACDEITFAHRPVADMFPPKMAGHHGRIEVVMMTRVAGWIGVGGLLLSLSGCGWFGTENSEKDSDDAIPELGERTKSAKSLETAKKELPADNLEFRLKVGTRFPLFKTVEQRLRQLSPDGGPPIDSSSLLTMKLFVTVEGIEQGVKRLGVRYQQVRYEHDIAGEKVSYDSALFPKTIPEAAWAYHGLVDNGFSFELGADNRIVQVFDFEAFLKRCVRHAPPHQQEALLTRLAATQEDEGIANFIDDSVGMLPYNADDLNANATVKVRASWRKNRQIMRPIPMTIDTAYRLGEINQRYATLELFGRIVPAQIQQASNVVQHASASERITLRNGHCAGTCTIDRESGLPIQSRVTRRMDLTLELPNGAKFDQIKEIVTTIRTFPEQGAPASVPQEELPSRPPTARVIRQPENSNGDPVAASEQVPGFPADPNERVRSPRRDEKTIRPAGYQSPK